MISTRRTTRAALALAAVCSLALLGACADGTDPGGDPDATETSEAPVPDGDEGAGTDDSDGDEGDDAEPLPDASDLPLEPGATGRGVPAGIDAPVDGGTGAAWTGEAGLLYVVTHGSSTCPTVPEPDATFDGDSLQVLFVEPPADQMCTMDFVPATTVVAVPDDVDPSVDVPIVLGTFGEGDLPALTGDGPGTPVWVGVE